MTQQLIDNLKLVRAKINHDEAWFKGTDLGIREEGRVVYRQGIQRNTQIPDMSWNCFCLRGAVYSVSDDQAQRDQMVEALSKTLNPRSNLWNNNVTGFNDDVETTHEMVLDLVDKTIERVAA